MISSVPYVKLIKRKIGCTEVHRILRSKIWSRLRPFSGKKFVSKSFFLLIYNSLPFWRFRAPDQIWSRHLVDHQKSDKSRLEWKHKDGQTWNVNFAWIKLKIRGGVSKSNFQLKRGNLNILTLSYISVLAILYCYMLHISKMVKKLLDSWLWNLNSWGLVYSERTNRKRASMGLGGSTKGAWQNSITVRVRAQPSGFAPFFWSSHSNKKEQGKTPQKMKQNSFHFWHGAW